MEEIHHTQKLDAPSGTAITLAKGIIDYSDYSSWALKTRPEAKPTRAIANWRSRF
jgi:4-hydroxy-tetrahydrodipicolinate reductase